MTASSGAILCILAHTKPIQGLLSRGGIQLEELYMVIVELVSHFKKHFTSGHNVHISSLFVYFTMDPVFQPLPD